MTIHKVEEIRCTRRRVPSSFSHKEETRPLCGAKAGTAKHLSPFSCLPRCFAVPPG
ncbi:hypothetical protein [Aneurinibacillus aneurinilyticus]|uniref:hypothetical protein n=1 Tax=Aneurinibacillus aneurinilyticus TaxID=1391 RepID=UPI0035253085